MAHRNVYFNKETPESEIEFWKEKDNSVTFQIVDNEDNSTVILHVNLEKESARVLLKELTKLVNSL